MDFIFPYNFDRKYWFVFMIFLKSLALLLLCEKYLSIIFSLFVFILKEYKGKYTIERILNTYYNLFVCPINFTVKFGHYYCFSIAVMLGNFEVLHNHPVWYQSFIIHLDNLNHYRLHLFIFGLDIPLLLFALLYFWSWPEIIVTMKPTSLLCDIQYNSVTFRISFPNHFIRLCVPI